MANNLYPLEVELDEKKILRLMQVFKSAQKEIEKEILTATDFGVANRKAILAQIDEIVDELAEETGTIVQKEIPFYYENGAKIANRQLKNIGADVAINEGFNRVHRQAIQALVDDTARAFAESMVGIKRNSRVMLGKAVRERITQRMAKGLISGEALEDVKNGIKEEIREKGIASLKDKANRTWTLDRYSEMLFRTKSVEARNRGLVNRMAEYNYDLVQVSNHNSSHDACRVWEGRILSITGDTKGYPTVAEAENKGLFHPNCKHAINVLIPSLARKTEAYNPDERTRIISKSEIEKATRLERDDLPRK